MNFFTNRFYCFLLLFLDLKMDLISKIIYPAGKIAEKASNVEECIFDYMASHIECRFNKNSLIQCYFLGILPAGYWLKSLVRRFFHALATPCIEKNFCQSKTKENQE